MDASVGECIIMRGSCRAVFCFAGLAILRRHTALGCKNWDLQEQSSDTPASHCGVDGFGKERVALAWGCELRRVPLGLYAKTTEWPHVASVASVFSCVARLHLGS